MHGCLTLFLSLLGGNPSPKMDISQEISCLYLSAWMTSMNCQTHLFSLCWSLNPGPHVCVHFTKRHPQQLHQDLILKDPQKARPLG